MPRCKLVTFTWQGRAFWFERLGRLAVHDRIDQWAVSRGGEFVGTMLCAVGIRARDFEDCCDGWLNDLFGQQAEALVESRH